MGSQKRKVILHLGVHKTATTHIQSRLYNSKPILEKEKIAYMGLDEVRNILTSKLHLAHEKFPVVKIQKELEKYKDFNIIVISDENILGGTNHPVSNKFYNTVRHRLSNLKKVFIDDEIDVHITIRNYTNYYISRYAEALRHYQYLSFDEYYKTINYYQLSWINLIDEIENILDTSLKISIFENIFKHENKYFEELLCGNYHLANASDDIQVRRSKFSKEKFELLQLYAKNVSKVSVRKFANFLDNQIQNSKINHYMPFTKFEQQVLDIKYEEDKNKLHKKIIV